MGSAGILDTKGREKKLWSRMIALLAAAGRHTDAEAMLTDTTLVAAGEGRYVLYKAPRPFCDACWSIPPWNRRSDSLNASSRGTRCCPTRIPSRISANSSCSTCCKHTVTECGAINHGCMLPIPPKNDRYALISCVRHYDGARKVVDVYEKISSN